MNLTTLHVDYWRERQREPQWMTALLDAHARKQRAMFAVDKRRSVSIHSIVNANAGGMRRPLDATNLCGLVRMAYKRAGTPAVCEMLEHMAGPNHYSTDSVRRRAYARKWLAKLNHNRST